MSIDERIVQDYLKLNRFLKRVLDRLRLLRVVEGSILVAAGAVIAFLTGAFGLAIKSFLPYAPFLVSVASLALFAFLLVVAAVRILRVPSFSVLARQVEEKVPALKDNLTNSLDLYRSTRDEPGHRELSRSLVAAQMARTSQQVSPISPKQILEMNRMKRYAKVFIPLALAFVVTWILSPSSLVNSWSLLARPWASLPPRATFLDLAPKGGTVAKGSRFLINASTWGKIPDEVSLRVWTEGGHESIASMDAEGEGKFRYLLRRAEESFNYQASSRGTDSPVYKVDVVPLPEVADLRLTSFPPEYSGLPPEVQSGGHISALMGTVVKMDITPTKEVEEGKIVFSETKLVPLTKTESSHLEGSLVLLSEGSYYISLEDSFGFGNPSPLRYQVRLIPDRGPLVEIIDPVGDQEVIGDEVLPLTYKASDDFGITEVRLGFRLAGKKEQKTTLWKGTARKTFVPQEFRWDLDNLALGPGDRMDYWLEVVDNDTISGPKEGFSETRSLIVKDLLKAVTEHNQGIQEIADALLDLLADHLEAAAEDPSREGQELSTKEALAERAGEILKQVEENLARRNSERDVADPTNYDLEMLQRNLAATVEKMKNLEPEAITPQLERMALLAEDMAKRARMDDVQALAQDIRNRERRLLSQLEELEKNLTDAGKAEALKELAKLQELMDKLMKAMSELAGQLPDDFINSDALEGMDLQDMSQNLDEIAKKLREGDLEGALQAARELLRNLGQMLAAMSQAGMETQVAEFDRLRSEMSNNESELDRIIAEQREILMKTEEMDKDLEKRREALASKRLEALREDVQEVLEELEKNLSRIEERGKAMELERLLDRGNLGEFARSLEQLKQAMRAQNSPSLAPSQEELEKLDALMQELNPGVSELIDDEEKGLLAELARREKSLQERTRNIQERLELLSQILPMMDPALAEAIGQASEFMGQAKDKLGRDDPPGAIPPERAALNRLSQSQRGMQALSRQMGMRAGRYAQGMAQGYGPRAGWYRGPWRPLPTLPQPGLKGFRRRQGYTGIQREEFRTPSKDAHQVPEMYREEIMKSLKDGYPSEYQKQVKKYFQNLAE